MQSRSNRFKQLDSYGLKYWPVHLASGGQGEILHQILLDFDWLEAKLTATGDVNALLDDFLLVGGGVSKDHAELVAALRLSAHILSDHPETLPGQLAGRLSDVHQLTQQIGHRLQDRVWLRPLYTTLERKTSLERVISAHRKIIWSLQALPDGQHVIAASGDGTLSLWDTGNGLKLRSYEGHTKDVRDVVLLKNGVNMVSGSDDGNLIWWEIESGKMLGKAESGQREIARLVSTPDGKRIVSLSQAGLYQVWDAFSRELVCEMQSDHGGTITGLVLFPDGKGVLSTCHSRASTALRSWELDPLKQPRNFITSDTQTCPVFLPDGNRFITIGQPEHFSQLNVWDLRNDSRISSKYIGGDYVVSQAFFLPEFRKLLLLYFNDRMLLHDIEGQDPDTIIAENIGAVFSACLLPGGKRLVTGDRDGLMKVWNLYTENPGEPVRYPYSGKEGLDIDEVCVFPDGRQIVFSTDQNIEGVLKIRTFGEKSTNFEIWNSEDAVVKFEREHAGSRDIPYDHVHRERRILSTGRGSRVTDIKISVDGKRLLAGLTNGDVMFWDQGKFKAKPRLLNHGTWIAAVAISGNGHLAVSAGKDALLVVWDLRSGRSLRILEGHSNWINDVALSFDGRVALSADDDKILKVWDVRRGRLMHELTGHSAAVNSVVILGNSSKAVSSSESGEVKIWDVQTGREIGSLILPLSAHTRLRVLPRDEYCVSLFRDGLLRIWSIQDGRPLAAFSGDRQITAFDITPDGSIIVAGDASGYQYVLRVEGLLSSAGEVTKPKQLWWPFEKRRG